LAGFTVPAAAVRGGSPASGEDAGRVTQLLRTPGLLRALTTSAVIISAVDLIVVYLPALGAERGLSAGLVGVLMTVRALFSMASRVLLGRMSSVFGRTRLMVSSIVVSAGALGAVTIPMPVWGLLVVLAAMGLGLGIGQPLTMSWLIEQTPPQQRGVALSLRLTGNRIGQFSVPSVMGLLAASLGAAGVLVATGLTVACTLLLIRGVRLEPKD